MLLQISFEETEGNIYSVCNVLVLHALICIILFINFNNLSHFIL